MIVRGCGSAEGGVPTDFAALCTSIFSKNPNKEHSKRIETSWCNVLSKCLHFAALCMSIFSKYIPTQKALEADRKALSKTLTTYS